MSKLTVLMSSWVGGRLSKEIHLTEADVLNLQIINKNPPSDEPFKFNAIRLPFVLRVDHLLLDHLVIKTQTNAVDFIILN